MRLSVRTSYDGSARTLLTVPMSNIMHYGRGMFDKTRSNTKVSEVISGRGIQYMDSCDEAESEADDNQDGIFDDLSKISSEVFGPEQQKKESQDQHRYKKYQVFHLSIHLIQIEINCKMIDDEKNMRKLFY